MERYAWHIPPRKHCLAKLGRHGSTESASQKDTAYTKEIRPIYAAMPNYGWPYKSRMHCKPHSDMDTILRATHAIYGVSCTLGHRPTHNAIHKNNNLAYGMWHNFKSIELSDGSKPITPVLPLGQFGGSLDAYISNIISLKDKPIAPKSSTDKDAIIEEALDSNFKKTWLFEYMTTQKKALCHAAVNINMPLGQTIQYTPQTC